MANTIEITNLSDTVLDALLALKAADETFDFSHLTRNELIILQEVSGENLRLWIATTPAAPSRRCTARGAYYEARILEAAEARYYAE